MSGIWTLDPMTIIHGSVLEDYYHRETAGFFHVTTQIDKVEREGLKSRRTAKKVGLGGGYGNQAPNAISFHFDFDRSMWLYKAMRSAVEVTSEPGHTADAIRAVLDWTGFPDGEWMSVLDQWEESDKRELERRLRNLVRHTLLIDARVDLGTLWSRRGWARLLDKHGDQIDGDEPSRLWTYKTIRAFESFLDELKTEDDFDGGTCVPIIGFTAPWDGFSEIRLDQISIVQAEVRLNVKDIDTNAQECEIRVPDKAVRIVQTRCETRGFIELPPEDDD